MCFPEDSTCKAVRRHAPEESMVYSHSENVTQLLSILASTSTIPLSTSYSFSVGASSLHRLVGIPGGDVFNDGRTGGSAQPAGCGSFFRENTDDCTAKGCLTAKAQRTPRFFIKEVQDRKSFSNRIEFPSRSSILRGKRSVFAVDSLIVTVHEQITNLRRIWARLFAYS